MHQSGIAPSNLLKEQFKAANDSADVLFVKIQIEDDDFVKKDEGKKTGNRADDFAAVNAVLEPSTPCYVLLRDDTSQKWVVVYYMPDKCPVRLKMIYASSTGALKSGLGGAKFIEDFPISHAEECTFEEYKNFTKDSNKEVVMSYDERTRADTNLECASMLSDTKVSAIVGIPIKVADSAIEALKALKEAAYSTVELILDLKSEVLGSAPPSNQSISELVYPENEPRYFVHNYTHTHGGEQKSKFVFIYYCPGIAPPRSKMFYSTCKSNIIKLFKTLDITDFHNLECNAADEVSEAAILEELYPKKTEDKSFKKPTARGRGRAKFAGKFQA